MIIYMFNSQNPKNIIAVTNRTLCERPFIEQIERICVFEPKAIILREKDLSEENYLLLAKDVLNVCRKYGVPLIAHTYINAARSLGLKAIHMPLPVLRASKRPQGFSVVGASVHSLNEAREAVSLGANYITAGHIYATDCKKGLPPRGLDFLKEICQNVDIPVYAIGGIKKDTNQVNQVMSFGAAGACIMSDLMRL